MCPAVFARATPRRPKVAHERMETRLPSSRVQDSKKCVQFAYTMDLQRRLPNLQLGPTLKQTVRAGYHPSPPSHCRETLLPTRAAAGELPAHRAGAVGTGKRELAGREAILIKPSKSHDVSPTKTAFGNKIKLEIRTSTSCQPPRPFVGRGSESGQDSSRICP